MDNSRLERIEEKVDRVENNINNINITLAAQHQSLLAHMKRTDTLEKILFTMIVGIVGLAIEVLRRSI